VTFRSFPHCGHSMHGDKPERFVETLRDWVTSLETSRRCD
jgi:pimeloyl-ACP methyl ester carboxylesterase